LKPDEMGLAPFYLLHIFFFHLFIF
jgi:hypothetical protein